MIILSLFCLFIVCIKNQLKSQKAARKKTDSAVGELTYDVRTIHTVQSVLLNYDLANGS